MKNYHEELLKWQTEFVRQALAEAGGSTTKAAQSCGLNRTHFYKFMRKLGFKPRRTTNKGSTAWQELGGRDAMGS
jgi:DNA-binding NtrC family response regulator